MLDLSVVICTYNGAARIPEVLNALQGQEGVDSVRWEVIVVDNNSTDCTEEVVRHFQECWPESGRLRYCFEPKQGKSFAFDHGFAESTGEFVAILDDDNIPEKGWVVEAVSFGQHHSRAGAFGGYIKAEFEAKPPSGFGHLAGAYAIKTHKHTFQYATGALRYTYPPGAGLVIRREAWLQSKPPRMRLGGPSSSTRVGAGEDTEMQTYIRARGWEIWYNPDMRIRHKMPASRLQRDKMLHHFKAIGLGYHHTRVIRHRLYVRPLAIVGYICFDFYKLLRLLVKNKFRIGDDIVVECKYQLYKYSMASPFYSVFDKLYSIIRVR